MDAQRNPPLETRCRDRLTHRRTRPSKYCRVTVKRHDAGHEFMLLLRIKRNAFLLSPTPTPAAGTDKRARYPCTSERDARPVRNLSTRGDDDDTRVCFPSSRRRLFFYPYLFTSAVGDNDVPSTARGPERIGKRV